MRSSQAFDASTAAAPYKMKRKEAKLNIAYKNKLEPDTGSTKTWKSSKKKEQSLPNILIHQLLYFCLLFLSSECLRIAGAQNPVAEVTKQALFFVSHSYPGILEQVHWPPRSS